MGVHGLGFKFFLMSLRREFFERMFNNPIMGYGIGSRGIGPRISVAAPCVKGTVNRFANEGSRPPMCGAVFFSWVHEGVGGVRFCRASFRGERGSSSRMSARG